MTPYEARLKEVLEDPATTRSLLAMIETNIDRDTIDVQYDLGIMSELMSLKFQQIAAGDYNRDLILRIRDGQVGSGMKHRE